MKFNIKDADGNVTNTIKANLGFVQSNFEHYEEWVTPTPAELTAEETARQWRDAELEATDKAAQTPDWPNRANILLHRTALRDWPSTSDFPETRPVLGE
tara:strand:+ start:726 stop:1022 length:297 start_codon:yes stop_codon:yes gene_type:complete